MSTATTTIPRLKTRYNDEIRVQLKDTLELGQRIWRAGIPEKSVPACAGCHGPAGSGIPVQYPRIAGQHAEDVARGGVVALVQRVVQRQAQRPVAARVLHAQVDQAVLRSCERSVLDILRAMDCARSTPSVSNTHLRAHDTYRLR